MRTSLHEIKQIEDYLKDKLSPDNQLVFESRMLVNPLLALKVKCQQKIHDLVKIYARKKWKNEVESAHEKMFDHPHKTVFQKEIRDLFSS